jgi:hypothetical protein
MPADGSLQQGSRVRIHSAIPLELTIQTDSTPATLVQAACCVSALEGRFVRVAGDTIILERGNDALNSSLNRVRGAHEILSIVRRPGTEVTVRQVDRARTTLLLLGITAAAIGLLAFAASQIEYDFPNSGGTF